VNYPALPRSGLPAPRLVRTGLPASMSELVPDVDTAVPDSAGDFPSQAVRSVTLLPDEMDTRPQPTVRASYSAWAPLPLETWWASHYQIQPCGY